MTELGNYYETGNARGVYTLCRQHHHDRNGKIMVAFPRELGEVDDKYVIGTAGILLSPYKKIS